MLHFTVDASQATAQGCHTCCCKKMSLKPGTTDKVNVGYAPWAVPIGELHCLPSFQLELMETCLPVASNNAPPQAVAQIMFFVIINGHLAGDLNTMIKDPDGGPLAYKHLPLYGPKYGKLKVHSNGVFDYDPVHAYKGADRFFFSADDGKNPPVIFEAMIAVGIDSAFIEETPHVAIGTPVVDQRYFTVSFPVTISPATPLCEIWRLTVQQGALDCDCTCFVHEDCYDIGIAKC